MLKLIKNKYKEKLLKIEGVNGVGIGLKNSSSRQGMAIIVSVERKLPESELKEVVPKKLLGFFQTDIVEAGEITTTYLKKHRPGKVNSSCCWEGGTACSLGLPLWDKDGNRHLLMNQHCANAFGSKIGDKVLQPSRLDGGKDKIGELTKYFFPVSKDRQDNKDVALVKLTEDVLMEDVEGNQYIPETRHISQNDILSTIKGGGRTIQAVRECTLVAYDYTADVTRKEGGKTFIARHDNCVFAFNSTTEGNPVVLGGDSSSIRCINNRPLLQTFAGSTVSAIFNSTQISLDWLEEEFGLKLYLSKPEEYYVALGNWLSFSKKEITTRPFPKRAALRNAPGFENTFIKWLPPSKIQMVGNKLIDKDGYLWIKVCL